MKTLIISFSKLLTTLVLALFAISSSLIAQQPNVTLSQPNLQVGRIEGQTQPLGVSAAQPQFKFWLAFEDSIGQTDTLWVVIDSTTNSSYLDSTWGEIPITQVDSGVFTTYFKYSIDKQKDTTKVYTAAPYEKEVGIWISAVNYHLPITIRWDTSLLTNNNLPWDKVYGFLYNDYIFDAIQFQPDRFLGLDKYDSVKLIPFTQGGGKGSHFPLKLYLTEEDFDPITVEETSKKKRTYISKPRKWHI